MGADLLAAGVRAASECVRVGVRVEGVSTPSYIDIITALSLNDHVPYFYDHWQTGLFGSFGRQELLAVGRSGALQLRIHCHRAFVALREEGASSY